LIGELCAHFGWDPAFWRRTPMRPEGMGWCELRGWIRELNRQRSAKETNPDSWAGRESDPFWSAMDQKRARRRGW
jgi:hypothetical protein